MPLTGRTRPLPWNPPLSTPASAAAAFRARYRRVVTFLGFGELGYDDESAFENVVTEELRRSDPAIDVINSGTLVTAGFARGVADASEIARSLGFRTSGLFPSVALQAPERHELSEFVDDVFFVEDRTWGGYLDTTGTPSPTLAALVSITDEVVAIGGGRHTAEELREFLRHGTPVRYRPLAMNQRVSRDWYRSRNEAPPDLLGAAHEFWMRRT